MAGPDIKIRIIPVELAFAYLVGPLFMKKARALTQVEKHICRSVFDFSVDPDPVLVGPTDVGPEGRPYTLRERIMVPIKTDWDLGVMVHELTHVWQYQNFGTRYISDSASDQVLKGQSAAYGIEGEESITPGKKFAGYQVEEQAMIVEGFFRDVQSRVGSLDDLDKLSHSAQSLLKDSRRHAPLSAGTSTKGSNRIDPVTVEAPKDWWYLFSSNADVIRMIDEVRRTRPLTSLQIYERDFPETAGGANLPPFTAGDPSQPSFRGGGTLPILQLRW